MFDIQQGVAIGLFVKRADGDGKLARVFHADLWGERQRALHGGKYNWLASNDIESTSWEELTPRAPRYLFIPRDEALAEEYEGGWAIPDVFPVNSVGIVTARDKLAIQWTRDQMKEVAAEFSGLSEEDARDRFNLRPDAQDWTVERAQADIRSHPDADSHITPILYRPFDRRWTYYTGQSRGFICRPRFQSMRHVLTGANVGISTTRNTEITGGWEHIFVSNLLIQHHTVSLKEVNYFFPLYIYSAGMQGQLVCENRPNLSDQFVHAFVSSVGLEFTADANGDLRTSVGPVDVLNYVYAVLHSPEYRRRYAEF